MGGWNRILSVEDETPAALIPRVLEGAGVENKIDPVREGKKALGYLFHCSKHAAKKSSPPPNLALFNLRLPKLEGHDVLAAIKQSEELNVTPVVAPTTANSEKDITPAYRKYAAGSLVEPLGSGEFSDMIRELGSEWLVRNSNPEKGDLPINKLSDLIKM